MISHVFYAIQKTKDQLLQNKTFSFLNLLCVHVFYCYCHVICHDALATRCGFPFLFFYSTVLLNPLE